MADPIIKIKRSAVPGKIPNTTTLPVGEFAINTYDGKVFIQQNQGGVGVGSTIIVVNPWSVGLGSTGYNTYFTVGSVGIGTTVPKAELNVVGVVSATSFFGSGTDLTGIVTSIVAGTNITVSGSTGQVTISASGGGGGGGSSQWITTDVGIHTLSNVGVGTTNPTSKLTVSGNANFTGVVTATSFIGSGTDLTGIVTSIVAGTNITVSGSTGQVTINSTATGGGGGAALDILEIMLFA